MLGLTPHMSDIGVTGAVAAVSFSTILGSLHGPSGTRQGLTGTC